MATQVHEVLVDDIDGSTADETVSFGLDGWTYEIDLSKENAIQLRDALAAYVDAARRIGSRAPSRGRGRGRGRPVGRGATYDTAEVRAWARAKGLQVNERGRIPADILVAYEKAHS